MKRAIIIFALLLVLPNAVILLLIDWCAAHSSTTEQSVVLKKDYQEGYWWDNGTYVQAGDTWLWISNMQYQPPGYRIKVKLPDGNTKFWWCDEVEGASLEKGSKVPVVRKSGHLFGTNYGYSFE